MNSIIAQLIPLNNDFNMTAYKTLNTTSNFECYNQCIFDSKCLNVVRTNKRYNNCFLRDVFDNASLIELGKDSEAYSINCK